MGPYSLPCGGAEHYCPEGSGGPLSVARGYFADEIALDLVGGTGGHSSQVRQVLWHRFQKNEKAMRGHTRYKSKSEVGRRDSRGDCRPLRRFWRQTRAHPVTVSSMLHTKWLSVLRERYRPTAASSMHFSLSSRIRKSLDNHDLCSICGPLKMNLLDSRRLSPTNNFACARPCLSSAYKLLPQTRCPIGSYCLGGVSFPCPAGRFGASQMSVDSSCSGVCSEGHFCPEGSHRVDQVIPTLPETWTQE